jgi:hypothetical protein
LICVKTVIVVVIRVFVCTGHFLQMHEPRIHVCPSVSSMCAQLLEHVASELPADVFRGAMASVMHTHAHTHVNTADNNELGDLITACVSALTRCVYADMAGNNNGEEETAIVCAKVVLCAGDANPLYVFTSSFSNSMQSVLIPATQTHTQGHILQGRAHTQGACHHALLTRWILVHADEQWDINTAVNESLQAYTQPAHAHTRTHASTHVPNSVVGTAAPFQLFAYRQGNLAVDECVFGLLFATLSPNHVCFAHTLLGVQSAIEYYLHAVTNLGTHTHMTNSVHDIENHASTLIADYKHTQTHVPTSVLGAILLLLAPPTHTQGVYTQGYTDTDLASCLIVRRPSLALLAYEFLYNVCSYPVSSHVVLAYLRKRSIDFLLTQLKFFIAFLRANVRSLCVSASAPTAPCAHAQQQAHIHAGLDTQIELIKTTRNHCLGWLLSMCAIEMRILGEVADVSTKRIKSLLQTLIGVVASTHTSAQTQSLCGVQLMLDAVCDHPTDNFRDVSNPMVTQCIDKCTVPHTLHTHHNTTSSRRGQQTGTNTRGANAQTPGSAASANTQQTASADKPKRNEFLAGFSVIDLPMFINLLEDTHVQTHIRTQNQGVGGVGSVFANNTQELSKADVVNGIQTAMEMNIYQLRLASCTHLAIGLTQLLECCVCAHEVSAWLVLGDAARTHAQGRSSAQTDMNMNMDNGGVVGTDDSSALLYTPECVTSVQRFFDCVCVPLLRSLFVAQTQTQAFRHTQQSLLQTRVASQTSSQQTSNHKSSLVEMIIAEKLIHCVVSQLSALRTVCGVRSLHAVPLAHTQHECLLQLLCSTLAQTQQTHPHRQRGHTSAPTMGRQVCKPQSSVYFRGCVYTALVLVSTRTQASNRHMSNNDDCDDNGDEDEDVLMKRSGLPFVVGKACRDVQMVRTVCMRVSAAGV